MDQEARDAIVGGIILVLWVAVVGVLSIAIHDDAHHRIAREQKRQATCEAAGGDLLLHGQCLKTEVIEVSAREGE